MTSTFFLPVEKERGEIVRKAKDIWAHMSEESFFEESFSSLESFYAFLQKVSVLDMACMDITANGSVEAAEEFRKKHNMTSLMLLADMTIMPNVYLKPTIMASSLLLRPIDEKQLTTALRELLLSISQPQSDDERVYSLKMQDGTVRVPYKDILCFEAREKKIFLRTAYEEYDFYDTIEKLSEQLPKAFARCHRSFLINTQRIKKIAFPEGVIYMDEDLVVPLSRSFRSDAKGWTV